MHLIFLVNEIFRKICDSVVESDGGRGDLAVLARTCRSLEEISLDVLWGERPMNLVDVLRTLPPDSWSYTKPPLHTQPSFSLNQPISPSELVRLRQYTTRVTDLRLHSDVSVNVQTFQTLIGPHKSFDWLSLWPKVRTLYWRRSPGNLQFLKYFLIPGVRNLEISLEGAGDGELLKTLALVESHCMNLEDLRLFDTEKRGNQRIQDTIRQIVYNNSSTLRLLHPPRDPPTPLVHDILQLPALRVLEMHIPKVPGPVPWDILPSLEYLNFTLDKPPDVMDLLGNLRKSKLRRFALMCPYPTSKGDRARLVRFFDGSGLYNSVHSFSWVPRLYGAPPTWEFVTTLSPFASMQALNLSALCGRTCHFNFRHEHVIELSRWMPRLRELYFGGPPCAVGGLTTDIGYHTLAALARNCPNLSLLSIHFNIGTFVTVDGVKPNWNVVYWDVGETALPADPLSRTIIALAASKLFPNAVLIGGALKDTRAWEVVREEFRVFTLPAVHMPLDLSI